MQFYVYILYNAEHDKFYIGQTYNLDKRLFEHNNKLSTYTAKYSGEWKIVYNEQYTTRAEAMNREKFLKKQRKNFF
ncbi:MAG: GIY-YIG nuclease family protein [Candidatus Falkowbacteria bacterium]